MVNIGASDTKLLLIEYQVNYVVWRFIRLSQVTQ